MNFVGWVGGFFLGVIVLRLLQSIGRLVEARKRPLNYFGGVVWPTVDDPRWRLVDGWLILGDVRCCTMTNKNEHYIFGVEFRGTRIRTDEFVRYVEAVERATLARMVLEQVEEAP